MITHWEVNRLLGKVKSWKTERFNVLEYKFGEPVYQSVSKETYFFSPFGFIQSSTSSYSSEYYNYSFEEEYKYLNEEMGLVENRKYQRMSDNKLTEIVQEFQYDSLDRKKQRMHRNLTTGVDELQIWSYEEGQERIAEYDENSELSNLQIRKFDSFQNLISDITYDKDGKLKNGNFSTYDKGELVKDSAVFKFSSSKDVAVYEYDRIGRIKLIKRFEIDSNESASGLQGSLINYESSNFNDSYTLKEFKGDVSIITEKYRFEIKTDSFGNITEKVKINIDTNSIMEKELFEYQYY